MKKNKISALLLIIVLLAGMTAYGFFSTVLTNDLGLTKFDVSMGELRDLAALQSKIIKVAETYLSQNAAEFVDICHELCEFKLNYSLKGKIRPLGYKSSFYYSHWNIYLPYSVSGADDKFILIVQIADMNGNINDPNNKFDVVRAIVIDNQGIVVKQIEGT